MPRPLDEVLAESEGYNGESAPSRQQYGWGDRFGAAVDSAQSNLYGVGEAMGNDWAGLQRRRNQAASEATRQRAIEDTGAPDSFRDVRGIRDAGRYVGGLFVDAAPQLASIAAAGMAAGPVGLTTTAGRMGLAAAASYPYNLGDVLQNQREQGGRTDLPTAAALAVPYTAADMVGVEGAIARGALARNTVKALDNVRGVRGGLARTAASMGRTAAVESGAETFQEGMNQLGRMAVDPNEEFWNARSADRFAESAVGGAAMGGAFGGAGGGWRRSTRHQPVDAGQPVDLTQRSDTQPPAAPEQRPLGLSFSGYDTGVGELVTFPDGTTMPRSEWDRIRPKGRSPDGSFDWLPPTMGEMGGRHSDPAYQYEGGVPFEEVGVPPADPRNPAAGLRMPIAHEPLNAKRPFDMLAFEGQMDVGAPARPLILPPHLNPAPAGPLNLSPAQEAEVYQVAAAKADRGLPLSPTEQFVLQSRNTAPRPANLQLPPERGGFRLDGGPTPQFDGSPRASLELTAPDASGANQMDLPLDDPRAQVPFEPATPRGNQRGVTGQLPFSANTKSPQGQLLQGMVDTLASDGYLVDGAEVQASTLIAQGKFAAAKKLIDEGAKNKKAAEDLALKARDEQLQTQREVQKREIEQIAAEGAEVEAAQLHTEIRALAAERAKLLSKNGSRPGVGSAKRDRWNALTDQIRAKTDEWGQLTTKAKGPSNADASGSRAPGAANAPAVGRVQPGGSQRNDAPVPAAGQPAVAAAPAGAGQEAGTAVRPDPERAAALDGVTSEALVEVADDAKDLKTYEDALDALYLRWRDEGDEVASAYFESNAKVRGFSADLARVRERAGEKVTAAAPKKPASEGKRGLKLGRVETGKLDDKAKETDDLLRGLATPKFMRERRENTPQRTERIQAFLDAVVDTWANRPTLIVVDSLSSPEVPGHIQAEDDFQQMQGAEADSPVAVYDPKTKTMYVFADAVPDSKTAMTAIFHEGLGHFGLRGVFGKATVPVLNSLAKARPDLMRKKAREYGFNLEDEVQRIQAADEVLAELAQTRPGLTWVQQLVAAVKTWLRENMPGFSKLQLSDAEIVRDYVLPARNWVERGQKITKGELNKVADYDLPEKPQFQRDLTARDATRADVARWTEKINPKVSPLVDALNDAGVFTTLSGDMYGDDLVYVDIEYPFDKAAQLKLPRGWVASRPFVAHTEVAHGLAAATTEKLAEIVEDAKARGPEGSPMGDGARGLTTRLSRLGGAVSVEEAGKVAEAVGGVAVKPQFMRAKNSDADQAVAQSFAKVPYAKTTLGQWVQDALFNVRESPWALKWVTNDQIAEGFKHLKPVQEINRATSRMAAVANRYLEGAAQTAKRWRALDDQVQLAMQRVMLQSTMDEMHVSIKGADGKYLGAEQAWKHSSNQHIEKTPANRVAFGKLYAEFAALPAPAKAVYDQVRDHLAQQHQDTLKALRQSVAAQYAGQLKRALTPEELNALASSDAGVKAVFKDTMDLTGSRTEVRALEGLYQALRDLNKDFGTVRGPYFPLVRFGDHVVVMKSKDLVDLELATTGLQLQLKQLIDEAPAQGEDTEAFDAQVTDLRTRYNEALKAVDKAKQDDKKYAVEFYESPAQAERARIAMLEKHPSADVYRSVREQYYRALDGASPAFLKDLTQTLEAALDTGDGVTPEAKTSALQAMKDMYLRRQPERSALRAELKRMNIEGVQAAQLLRGYAQASRNGAWRVSRLLHAGEVTDGLAALSQDRRSPDAKHVLNELKSRFVGDIAPPEDNALLRRAQATTYFMHLGFNLSYFLTNATQAWTTSLPVMGGRHGIVNSANSLAAASKDVIALLSKATAESIEENGAVVGLQLRLTDEQINSLAKDAGEARMLKELTDDGVIDITIKHDLGALSDGTTKSIPGRVMELSSALANYPELYNRLSTALAAYRMESARREGANESAEQVQVRAQEYAENIINRTHFNYSPENAPRMMRGQLGRLVFQFKRYQQGMIYLFARLIKQSSNGDKDAQRSLAYLLGMTTAVGGVAALPLAAPVALAAQVLAAAYPDDDEPQWMQQWYNGMKDAIGEDAAQLMVKGLPTGLGLDLSGKLGQGNLLNPVAFANTAGKDTLSSDWWTAVTASLMGPAAMMAGKQLEAAGQLLDGNVWRAAELATPTFTANALKAYRRATDGETTKAGDTLLEADEFSAWATAAKAAGFESVKVSDTYDNRSAYMQAMTNRQDARKALLRQYYEAVKTGDSDAMESTQAEIRAFNDRQPADRVKPGDLAASIKQHAKRSSETRAGLRVGKRDADTYGRLMGEE